MARSGEDTAPGSYVSKMKSTFGSGPELRRSQVIPPAKRILLRVPRRRTGVIFDDVELGCSGVPSALTSASSESTEIPSAFTVLHSVPTDGLKFPRSIWESRLGERAKERARPRSDIPERSRFSRILDPSALVTASTALTRGCDVLATCLAIFEPSLGFFDALPGMFEPPTCAQNLKLTPPSHNNDMRGSKDQLTGHRLIRRTYKLYTISMSLDMRVDAL
jgi:hypothetical protein